MAPKKIKLTYFAGRGLGELPRLILAAANVQYDNVRVKSTDWPKIKEESGSLFLYGAMPILECELDGETVVLAQSKAIARFLAKQFGLAGKTRVEEAQADMVVDLVLEYLAVPKVQAAIGEEEKRKRAKMCLEEDFPKFLKLAEKALKESGGKHYVGGKLSWADIYMFETLINMTDATSPLFTKYMEGLFDDRRINILKDYPLLTGLVKTVQDKAGIKKWLKERPTDAEEPY